MTVYIEYVLVNNFIIDFFLLKTAYMLMGKEVKWYRLILSAVFGGCFSLLYPLINLGGALSFILKTAVGMLMVIISASFKRIREFIISFFLFLFLTGVLGGSIFMAVSFIGMSEITEFLVAICCIPAYFLLLAIRKIIAFIYSRRRIEGFSFEVEIELEGKRVKTRGFLDTGNNVSFKGSPAVICDKSFFKQFIGDIKIYRKLEKIKIGTANGESENFCVKLSSIKILNEGKENILYNVYMVIAEVNIIGAELILHTGLFEMGGENDETNRQVKKAS